MLTGQGVTGCHAIVIGCHTGVTGCHAAGTRCHAGVTVPVGHGCCLTLPYPLLYMTGGHGRAHLILCPMTLHYVTQHHACGHAHSHTVSLCADCAALAAPMTCMWQHGHIHVTIGLGHMTPVDHGVRVLPVSDLAHPMIGHAFPGRITLWGRCEVTAHFWRTCDRRY